jgi:cation diffusion facilitator CzcD-associated flavoprotein CzcO
MMSAPAATGFPSRCRVAIVGGGITGLSAAHRLIETDAVDPSIVSVARSDPYVTGSFCSRPEPTRW